MSMFRDRREAGEALAARLIAHVRQPDVVVLALPRGGVPVGFEVATALGAPLDVFAVRKLGVPGHEEFAMGAVASGGIRVLNEALIRDLGIDRADLEAITLRELRELDRRVHAYRDHRPFPSLDGNVVILVDDGVATGSSMTAAVRAVREFRPRMVIVATPVMSRDARELLGAVADQVVAVAMPEPFLGVGAWYADFTQTTDDEVRALLDQAARRRRPNNGALHVARA